MGTLLRSDNATDSLCGQECSVRLSAKLAHNSELQIYDVDVQLFFSWHDKQQTALWCVSQRKFNPHPAIFTYRIYITKLDFHISVKPE